MRGLLHDQQAVIISDLAQVTGRWPIFVPRALEIGVHAVHAFPLRLRESTIGALNLFADTPLPFSDAEVAIVQALADIVTIGILQQRAVSAAEALTQQRQSALNSRIVIEQDKGVVAQRLGVSLDRAFALLRSFARSNHLRLSDLCRDASDGTVDPRTLCR